MKPSLLLSSVVVSCILSTTSNANIPSQQGNWHSAMVPRHTMSTWRPLASKSSPITSTRHAVTSIPDNSSQALRTYHFRTRPSSHDRYQALNQQQAALSGHFSGSNLSTSTTRFSQINRPNTGYNFRPLDRSNAQHPPLSRSTKTLSITHQTKVMWTRSHQVKSLSFRPDTPRLKTPNRAKSKFPAAFLAITSNPLATPAPWLVWNQPVRVILGSWQKSS